MYMVIRSNFRAHATGGNVKEAGDHGGTGTADGIAGQGARHGSLSGKMRQ